MSHREPDPRDDEIEPAPTTPRWVKVFGVGFLVLLLGIAVMLVHGFMTGTGPFQHQPIGR